MTDKIWYRIRATRKTAEILIYEEIGGWGVNANRFLTDLAALQGITEINVRIHSPGGDLFDALAIYNALQRHPARIVTVVDGLCASAATLVALAGDETHMVDNGLWMIHEPWVLTAGDAEDHQKRADLLDATAEQIVGIYVRKTGLAADAIRDMMRAETWMTAAQALDLGFVDVIDEPLRIAAKAFDLSNFRNPPRGIVMEEELIDPVPTPPVEAPTEGVPPPPVDPLPDPELTPVEVARACLAAQEAEFIPVALASPMTAMALQARLGQAAVIRALCAATQQPGRAVGYIASNASIDAVKADLWDALVALDRAAGEIDATPPPRKPAAVIDPVNLARLAMKYQAEQAAQGQSVSMAAAVEHMSRAQNAGATQ